MIRLLPLIFCGLSFCLSHKTFANIDFLEKLDCAFGMNYDDPNLLAYLDQHQVEFRSDYFTHKSYHSFTHPEGIEVKLYTAENKKKFSSIELYFENSEVSQSANSWLLAFGISQGPRKTIKKYRGDMSYLGEEPYYKNGYHKSQVAVIRTGNVWYTVRWNTDDKKAQWVREFHLRSQAPVNSTSTFPEMPRRTFAHEDFQPDQPASYFSMFNRSFSEADIEYMTRYFRWTFEDGLLKAPDGSFFKVSLDGAMIHVKAFHFTSMAHIPKAWTAQLEEQKKLMETHGRCGHENEHLADLIFYEGDQECFRLKGYVNDGAETVGYTIERIYDDFKFTSIASYAELKPKLGCSLSSTNCESGFGEFHFGDGCYFKGDFKNGEFHNGVILYRKDHPARYINKEMELAQ